jgi:hypothetical protein
MMAAGRKKESQDVVSPSSEEEGSGYEIGLFKGLKKGVS